VNAEKIPAVQLIGVALLHRPLDEAHPCRPGR
jgi:hypothetical protein